jgi:uncharacterized membrane protein
VKQILTRAGRSISGVFFQGLAITLPITITVAVIYWLVDMAEDFLGGLVRHLFPEWQYWTGLGVIIAIALVFVAGILMNVWIARFLLARAEALLEHIPLVKSLYGTLRDIASLFSHKDANSGFKNVVAVRIGEQMRLVGFVTLDDYAGLPRTGASPDETTVGVYLPMSYQVGGYTVFLPKSQIEPLDMSVEDAMRFTLTAGVSGSKATGS